MATHSFPADQGAMSRINVTPLVDVMLVLLIIFMITAPMLTHRMELDLPQRSRQPPVHAKPPPPLRLVIQADGSLNLDGIPVSERGMRMQLGVYGSKPLDEQPELQISASNDARYSVLAKVLADAKDADMQNIGFRDTDRSP